MTLNNISSSIPIQIAQAPNTGDSKLNAALSPLYNAIRQLQSNISGSSTSISPSVTLVPTPVVPVSSPPPGLTPTETAIASVYGILKSIGYQTPIQALPRTDYEVPLTFTGSISRIGDIVTSSDGSRNRLHNGDIRIDQTNIGVSQTFTAGAALSYCVDRFYGYCTGANVIGQQVQLTSGQYRYKFTGASSNTRLGFAQRIEAKDCMDMAGTACNFQVLLSSSSLTSVTWTAYYANTSDTFGSLASPTKTLIATGNFTISSVETVHSTNISIPSGATTGIEIVLSTGALLASQTLQIGNLQFEPGVSATPFEWIPYELSFLKCARRCFAIRCSPGSFYSIFSTGFGGNSTQASFPFNLPTPMVYTPTLTVGNLANMYLAGVVDIISLSSMSLTQSTTLGFKLDVNVTSGITHGACYLLCANNSNLPYLILRAEIL